MENKDRSGKAFIVYQGTEYTFDSIVSELKRRSGNGFKVRVKTVGSKKVIFAKVVYNEYEEDRDPFCNNGIITVSGYTQKEMMKANYMYLNYDINDEDKSHQLVNYLYRDYGTDVFSKLSDMHFCSVIYDTSSDKIIAGVTEASVKYTNLFYGYTRQNHELMFSNLQEALTKFCDEIEEMENNTYIMNGEFYSLDGTKDETKSIKKFEKETSSLIKKDNEIVDNLINGLNALLINTMNEKIQEKLVKNVEEYLDSFDLKKKIKDSIFKELDTETQKHLLEKIKNVMNDFNIENYVYQSLQDLFHQKLDEYEKQIHIPVVHIIKLKDTELGRTSGGFYHEKFEEVLSLVQLDEPVMLIGPAGSGKNYSISQIAQALGLPMYYTNNASNEFKLTGFIDAGGHYRDTEFYKAFKNGGLFFLDEIDNSDPSSLIVINSALANGYMAFPHETINRHPNFRMVAAANTWGKGSDLQYVGRNTLDGATLDRFDNVFFNYDRKLEEALYPNEQVLQFMWAFRDAVEQEKISHIVSTRGIGKVYKKEINGIPVETILRTNIIRNLDQDDLNILIGSMKNINDSNKYYAAVKTLKLGR